MNEKSIVRAFSKEKSGQVRVIINKMKRKENLKDVTFLIPVRIDSKERLENFNVIMKFIKTNFDTTIVALEADKKEQVSHQMIDKKVFINDDNQVFHRTKYLIQMVRLCKTPYIAIWDADVVIETGQIIKSVKLLRKKKADMVIPYDGNFFSTPPMFKCLYKKRGDMDIFVKNRNRFLKVYGHFSVGGAFIVNREGYINAGMENENFYGWGIEDAERVKRWEILGYKIKRVHGALFHLDHPRQHNSWYANKEIEKRSKSEYLKICAFNSTQLKNYIKSWANDCI